MVLGTEALQQGRRQGKMPVIPRQPPLPAGVDDLGNIDVASRLKVAPPPPPLQDPNFPGPSRKKNFYDLYRVNIRIRGPKGSIRTSWAQWGA